MQTHQFGTFTIHYVPRENWDLRGRAAGSYIGPARFHGLVPHHTVTGFVRAYYELVVDRMRYLQVLRPDLGGDIPYNFVVFAGADENEAWVAEGRGIGWTGAHTYGYNSTTHAAAFWGNSITDPVDPAVLEAVRFVGRMMVDAGCPIDWETLDHGSYPNQGTQCAGTKLRAALPALQPPFNSVSGGVVMPPQDKTKDDDVYSFHKRPGPAFAWPGYSSAKAFDSAVTDHGDEITVSLIGGSAAAQATRNVTLLHPNGAQETKAVQWGLPASFISNGSGWCSLVVGEDGFDVIRVEGRG